MPVQRPEANGRRTARTACAACGLVALVLAFVVTVWTRGEIAGSVRDDLEAAAVQIYPTADRLPANLLRLYLVFDRAMSAGESRTHLVLLDDGGRPIERAFLQLEDELWDPSGRRLTVLFDPGRIKRGLKANLESGPPLVEGRRYRLVVEGGWRDASGRPLGVSTSKVFEAIASDRESPMVDDWTVESPAMNTRAPLVLRFPEVLDRSLLSSAIDVVDGAGAPVPGAIDVLPGERTWRLVPDRAWQKGAYRLRVSSELEDVAGNSLRRVFDADMAGANPGRHEAPLVLTRTFSVAK